MVFAENILRIFRENKLLAKYRLKDVFVFGSSVRTATPNDIDILVRDFQDYNDLLSLRKELSEKTGKSVDVVIEKFANPIILYRASKESIRVE
ncbi:nucleotidyltransferase family protein [Fibrobacter succinogenes]|uniref:nucleotidyltransferase family protein n=1 Tax=Fibrobacter succinogenes TaxID=833 RepID=UPI001566FFD2|nr:nucleotidyltransferase domain-containing protein [Fibrobacter succinogenes]